MTTAEFISSNLTADVRRLALAGHRFPEVDMPFALDQIRGWQMARTKLPSWASTEGMVYPPHLAMEQCSSEAAARYKASVAGSGQTMVDLTGGFGVDFSFMARGFARAVYVERQEALARIARGNFLRLQLSNAEVVAAQAEDYLQSMAEADLVYLDPARRDDHGGRTYALEDCQPNVLALCPLLLKKAPRVMVKLSPMLDWHRVVQQLQCVTELHIVSVQGECKELLVVMQRQAAPLTIHCVNDSRVETFLADALPSRPLPPPVAPRYLYEPNASLMKAGCFALLGQRYGVSQVGASSHLFVGEELVDFPGRRFHIATVTTMNRRQLSQALAGITQANVAVRNFPLTAQALRQRLKLRDGGDKYIFGTTDSAGQHVLYVCGKV